MITIPPALKDMPGADEVAASLEQVRSTMEAMVSVPGIDKLDDTPPMVALRQIYVRYTNLLVELMGEQKEGARQALLACGKELLARAETARASMPEVFRDRTSN